VPFLLRKIEIALFFFLRVFLDVFRPLTTVSLSWSSPDTAEASLLPASDWFMAIPLAARRAVPFSSRECRPLYSHRRTGPLFFPAFFPCFFSPRSRYSRPSGRSENRYSSLPPQTKQEGTSLRPYRFFSAANLDIRGGLLRIVEEAFLYSFLFLPGSPITPPESPFLRARPPFIALDSRVSNPPARSQDPSPKTKSARET